jgi:hypothetical protein
VLERRRGQKRVEVTDEGGKGRRGWKGWMGGKAGMTSDERQREEARADERSLWCSSVERNPQIIAAGFVCTRRVM